MTNLNKDILLDAWENHSIPYRSLLNTKFNKMFDTFETEMLYSFVKYLKPKKIIEIGPNNGFTSTLLIKAAKSNNTPCNIYSFDLLDTSSDLDFNENGVSRTLIVGDAREAVLDYIDEVDFVFIDADHRYPFGEWYCKNIFTKLQAGTPIWIHDWEGYEHDDGQDEIKAVKDHGIQQNIVKPVLNLMDFVIENRNFSTTPKNMKVKFAVGDRSPSQILEKT